MLIMMCLHMSHRLSLTVLFNTVFADSLDIKMNIGQLVQGIVKSIDKTRGVVYLNANPDFVSKCVVSS